MFLLVWDWLNIFNYVRFFESLNILYIKEMDDNHGEFYTFYKGWRNINKKYIYKKVLKVFRTAQQLRKKVHILFFVLFLGVDVPWHIFFLCVSKCLPNHWKKMKSWNEIQHGPFGPWGRNMNQCQGAYRLRERVQRSPPFIVLFKTTIAIIIEKMSL